MLFGEGDITWDDLEKVTDGYFDGFAKEDCQIKAASDLVEYLTVDNTTSLLVEMLKMKTGDLSDGNTEGKLFRPFYSDGPTKKQLLDMTKRGEMIVIRPVKEPESISTAICKNRTGEVVFLNFLSSITDMSSTFETIFILSSVITLCFHLCIIFHSNYSLISYELSVSPEFGLCGTFFQ